MVAEGEAGAGEAAGGVELVGVGRDAGEPLLDAFELADRDAELGAHPRIGAGRPCRHRSAGGRKRREGDAPTGGQRRVQHHPAFADLLAPAENGV